MPLVADGSSAYALASAVIAASRTVASPPAQPRSLTSNGLPLNALRASSWKKVIGASALYHAQSGFAATSGSLGGIHASP